MAGKPKKNLKCAHCGSSIPDTHRVYRYRAEYKAAVEGKPVFCNRSHGLMYRHAMTDMSTVYSKISQTKTTWVPTYDLTCTYCGDSIPEDHKVYRKRGSYMKVKSGVKNVFCCPSHSSLHSNATRDPSFRLKIGDAKRRPIPAYDLTCTYCGDPLPEDHKAYKTIGAYTKAKEGSKNVFCCPSHAGLHQHASLTDKQRRERGQRITQSMVNNDSAAQRHETRKANGSYLQSKPELEILHRLRKIIPDIEHQYRKCEGYPYAADFYDPSTNTVFEHQGFFSHGTEPYDPPSSQHRLKVKELKKTAGWAAKLTLNVWCSSDPEKRKMASEAGINFVEWFNMDQFNAWYSDFVGQQLGADKSKGLAYKFGSRVACSSTHPDHNKFKSKYPNLITFYPWEDLNKVANLVKDKIVLYARKLEVRLVSKSDADSFCDKFHIQGRCRGTEVAVALLNGDEIVGVMTFGKPRYNKAYDYELLRLCYSKVVVGGTKRMWKAALSELGSESSIISYCDLSKFNGSIYSDLGFVPKAKPRPSLHWYNPVTDQHVTDNLLRKHGFDQLVGSKIGQVYGQGTDNASLMRKHGFICIEDEGQQTFIYNN